MKKLLLIMTVFVLALTAGCASGTKAPEMSPAAVSSSAESGIATGTTRKIFPEDVKKMMDEGSDFILVDVRTVEEFNAGHIEGALNIPVETISNSKPALLPDQDAMIVLYCRSGNRTVTAYKALVELGYTNVYDMGGIIDWPYETVTTASASAEPSPSVSDAEPSAVSSGILGAFYATDIDGNFIDASIWEGHKLTMVNIWGTFCSPCIQEMPELGKLSQEYADKGVQIVGIVIDAADRSGDPLPDMVSLAKEIVSVTKADYPHILPSSDLNNLLLKDIAAVPTTIFVDENGNQIGEMYVGSRSGDDWAALIESLLKEVG